MSNVTPLVNFDISTRADQFQSEDAQDRRLADIERRVTAVEKGLDSLEGQAYAVDAARNALVDTGYKILEPVRDIVIDRIGSAVSSLLFGQQETSKKKED